MHCSMYFMGVCFLTVCTVKVWILPFWQTDFCSIGRAVVVATVVIRWSTECGAITTIVVTGTYHLPCKREELTEGNVVYCEYSTQISLIAGGVLVVEINNVTIWICIIVPYSKDQVKSTLYIFTSLLYTTSSQVHHSPAMHQRKTERQGLSNHFQDCHQSKNF